MTMDVQTPRRSKRYQPLVDTRVTDEDEGNCAWLGSSIFSRETRADDLHEEDIFGDEETETVFYEGFTRINYEKRKTVVDDEFNVGDTVLVKTQAKLASVGVIVAMWEVRVKGDSDGQKVYQKVKIHWFLRPSELPSVRARRDHLQVCMFCYLP